MSINEIINEIKRNMYISKEMEKILSELSDDEYNELKSKIKNEGLLRKIEAIRKSRPTKPNNCSPNRFDVESELSIHYPNKSDDEPSL